MIKPRGLHHADALSNAVLSGIFARDLDGNWIEVASNDGCIQRFRRGDGEDAGAGADIDDMPRASSLGEPVECKQAATRRGVMGSAEGKACIDFKRETPWRHLAAIMTPMHQEAAGAHRPPQPLRLPHPI